MVNVFFRGYGRWVDWLRHDMVVLDKYPASGVFNLCDEDFKAAQYLKKLPNQIDILLPNSTHTDSEFLRRDKDWQTNRHVCHCFGTFGLDIERCHFEIDHTRPSEIILIDVLAFEQQPQDERNAVTGAPKQQKKLIPKKRSTTELLELIYKMLDDFGMKTGDKQSMTAKELWGQIIAGKYMSDFIKQVTGTRDTASIELNGGDIVDFNEFTRTYNRRFK